MLLQVGFIKGRLRRFIAEKPNQEIILERKDDQILVNRAQLARGISLHLPVDTLNENGDYMTDEEKQELVDTLTAIVDEHNATLTDEE